MNTFFDAHLHLFDPRLSAVQEAVEQVARDAGVTACIACAAFPKEWPSSLRSQMVVTRAYGLHPWFVAEATATHLAQLREYLQQDTNALLGEIGLDGLRPTLDAGAVQYCLLDAQLALAATLGRPVILHGARAWQMLFDCLLPWAKKVPAMMFHGAGFSPESLRHPLFQKANIWVSIGGAVVSPRAKTVRALAAKIPADRLLIETDSPDMLPFGASALPIPSPTCSFNHPGNLPLIAETLATLRGSSLSEIAAQTFSNAQTFICGG